jgi:BlaI family penicillinase repressor
VADAPNSPISAAEREVLKILWEHGPAGVRDVHSRLTESGQNWTRSTVITLLQRLERKGCVASDRTQFAFVFRAIVSREQLMHSRLLELADELSDGNPLPLVAAFAEQHRFTAAEVQQFRELIEKLDAERRKRGSR